MWSTYNEVHRQIFILIFSKNSVGVGEQVFPWLTWLGIRDLQALNMYRHVCWSSARERENASNLQREGERVLFSPRAARYWFWDVEATLTFCAENVSPHCGSPCLASFIPRHPDNWEVATLEFLFELKHRLKLYTGLLKQSVCKACKHYEIKPIDY